ncbi:MAG TPA: FecR domain-containing protein [Polyangiaceae bacterium]
MTKSSPRASGPTWRRPLAAPLGKVLCDPVEEASIARMWHAIDARRSGATAWFQGRYGRPLAVALAALLVAVVAGAVLEQRRAAQEHRTEPKAGLTSLVLEGGRPFEKVAIPRAGRSLELSLNDGSRVVVSPGTTLEPLANSASEVIVRLASGRAAFRVNPGGPRRWSVEAGLCSVSVTGTEFIVERSPQHVHVAVRTGTVLVRGDRVLDGVARLAAGQSLRVSADSPALSASRAEADAAGPALVPRVAPGWQASAARGDHAAAYAELGAAGIAREAARAPSADDLLALADVARLSGHPHAAVPPLERLLEQHATSPRAVAAAVTLGRIELDLGRPARAATVLERALTLGVPAGLKEDVYVRLVEAYAKSNRSEEARRTSEVYRQLFPEGRRTPEVEHWLTQ